MPIMTKSGKIASKVVAALKDKPSAKEAPQYAFAQSGHQAPLNDAARNEVFKANLPRFRATIFGNVVTDAEGFTARSGDSFTTFRIAYNRKAKNASDVAMFIKVITSDEGVNPRMGDYVSIEGDYHDDGATPGNKQYPEPTVFRTLFHKSEDHFEVILSARTK